MDLCMTHRFEDLHDCKPVVKNEMIEKLKTKNKIFNWKMKKPPKNEKVFENKQTFGEKLVRFFVCCGPKEKKDDVTKKQNVPPQSKRRGELPAFQHLKCPLCSMVFEDQNMLIFHTNQEHKEIASTSINKSEPI